MHIYKTYLQESRLDSYGLGYGAVGEICEHGMNT
jgi:hypothetical protein